MKNIELNLTVEETNTILEALSQAPYKLVFELVSKIQETAQGQLETTNEDASA